MKICITSWVRHDPYLSTCINTRLKKHHGLGGSIKFTIISDVLIKIQTFKIVKGKMALLRR